MMDEYDPMPDLMAIVDAAAPELEKIVVGAFPGNQSQVGQSPPFAFLRSVGGPEEDDQDPEAERRLDITVFAATEKEANRISSLIHRHIRRRSLESQDEEVCLPSLFSAGGPLDILERDVKLPGVFRSYYLIYDEEDCP